MLPQQKWQRKTNMKVKPIKIKIYPAISTLAYISAGSNGYAIKRKQWLRSANPDVHHYGLKYAIYNLAANQTIYWRIKYTAYLSVKQIH